MYCTFNNCNFIIANGNSSSNENPAGAIAGLVFLGGLYLTFNPVALGSVLALGATIGKAVCITGIGSSVLCMGTIITKANIRERKERELLEIKNQDLEFITSSYRVLEDKIKK